ncbi:MAG: hypothetical protein AAGE94_07065, partial [Acidobacteriota bacterium]
AIGDVLVTVDGDRIETQGPWEVRGRQVIFTDAQGRHAAMRLTDIDLDASDAATREAAAPPPPPAPDAAPPPAPPVEPVLTLTNDNIGAGSGEAPPGAGGSADLRATVGVVANHHRVTVRVNGTTLPSFSGGQSEAVQLFHVDSPRKAEMERDLQTREDADEWRKYLDLFCLRSGENTLEVDFEQVSTGLMALRVYVNANHYSVPILDWEQDEPASGSWSTTFEIYDVMPEGYATVNPQL